MGRLNQIVRDRRAVVSWYRERLADNERVRWPLGYEDPELSMQSLVMVLDPAVDRDQVIQALAAEGIGSTIGGYSVAEQPYYEDRYDLRGEDYPVSSMLGRQSLTLPVTTTMVEADVEQVVATLEGALLAGAGR